MGSLTVGEHFGGPPENSANLLQSFLLGGALFNVLFQLSFLPSANITGHAKETLDATDVARGHSIDPADTLGCGPKEWMHPKTIITETWCKQTGMEAIERLRLLASFGPPSTGKRKGGEKTQPFNRFHSHHGTLKSKSMSTQPS